MRLYLYTVLFRHTEVKFHYGATWALDAIVVALYKNNNLYRGYARIFIHRLFHHNEVKCHYSATWALDAGVVALCEFSICLCCFKKIHTRDMTSVIHTYFILAWEAVFYWALETGRSQSWNSSFRVERFEPSHAAYSFYGKVKLGKHNYFIR